MKATFQWRYRQIKCMVWCHTTYCIHTKERGHMTVILVPDYSSRIGIDIPSNHWCNIISLSCGSIPKPLVKLSYNTARIILSITWFLTSSSKSGLNWVTWTIGLSNAIKLFCFFFLNLQPGYTVYYIKWSKKKRDPSLLPINYDHTTSQDPFRDKGTKKNYIQYNKRRRPEKNFFYEIRCD